MITDLDIGPGKYVVAVSGGVDSVVLLDLLVKKFILSDRAKGKKPADSDKVQFIVAHLDHGMREDSVVDRRLVQELARKHKLPFVYHTVRLGAGASEESARLARYGFLHGVRKAAGAKSIIMAHHQDDLLETAMINLIRGTGRKGLTSLHSTDDITRPLLHLTKADLINYAQTNKLPWREDSTNRDTRYLRNHIRHNVMPHVSAPKRQQLLDVVNHLHGLNRQIDHEIINHLHLQPAKNKMDRYWFTMLPHNVAREVLASWLRQSGVQNFDRKTLERIVVAGKTYRPGYRADINRTWRLLIGKESLALVSIER